MREFSIIHTKIWHDAKFKALNDKERQLFLYILCCPHGNMIGCFTLPIGYVAVDLGWTLDEANSYITSLINKGFILYDLSNNLIFIKNYLKHNKASGQNSEKGCINLFKLLPSDSFLTKKVGEMMNFYLNLDVKIPENAPIQVLDTPYFEQNNPLTSPLQAPSKDLHNPLNSPLQAPCKAVPQEIEIEMEIEMDIERERKTSTPQETASTSSVEILEIFNFWKERTGHKKAPFNDVRKKQIRAAMKRGYSKELIFDAIEGCCATPHNQGKTDGQRWDDLELILRPTKIDRFIRNKTELLHTGSGGFDATVRNLQQANLTLDELLPL